MTNLVPAGHRPAARLNYRYLDDQVLLDTEGAYTIVSLPTLTWTMRSSLEKRAVLARTISALGNLPRGGSHHARLITTQYPFNSTGWATQLSERVYAHGNPTPGLETYLADMRDQLNAEEWPTKAVYLVVRLGDRANWDGALGRVKRSLSRLRSALDLDDEMPDLNEIAFWADLAGNLRTTLQNSFIRAQPVGRAETEMLLRHLTHPGLPIPDGFAAAEGAQPYGPGELRVLCGGETQIADLGRVEKYRYKCVQHDTAMGTSYQVHLALSAGPEEIMFPHTRWLDLASQLPFDVTQSIGFEIEEGRTTRRDADRALRNLDEQFYTDADAGVSPDLTNVQKAEVVKQMKYLVQHHRLPFVRMRALFSVADTDKENLRDKVREVIRHYREHGGYTLDAPPSNQRFWFYEGLPAGIAADADYRRRVSLEYFASGMPHLSPAAGEGEGFYQGFTITEAGGRGEPVFVDHLLYATGNKAPTEAVPGEPGGGKTVSRGLKPAWEDALRGITQVIWDPKGDYLVLKYHASQLGLDPDRITTINVLDAEPGMLDPAALAEDDNERASLMREVLLRLAPDLFVPQSPNAAVYGDVVRQAVEEAVKLSGTGVYLMKVVEVLDSWEHLEERPGDINHENKRHSAGLLARRYRTLADSPLGLLVFARQRTRFRVPAGHTVIFCTLGMKTPEPGMKPLDMNDSQLLSDVIFGLMADYTWNLLARLPVEVRKSITWDEWHTSKDNPRAVQLVDRVQRLGRARNTFLRLISQSAGDFPSAFITAVWAFGVHTRAEAEKTCVLLGVEATPDNVNLIQELVGAKGRCVVRDRDGNLAIVQVEFLYGFVLDLFDTNPEKDPEKMQRIVAELLGPEAARARAAIDAARFDAELQRAAGSVVDAPDETSEQPADHIRAELARTAGE